MRLLSLKFSLVFVFLFFLAMGSIFGWMLIVVEWVGHGSGFAVECRWFMVVVADWGCLGGKRVKVVK